MEEIKDNEDQEKERVSLEETPSETLPIQTAEDELEKMKQELDQKNDMMLRIAAELDNYKKRVAKERESLIKYAAQEIIQELLPILDNFERAVESASKSNDFDSFFEGVKLVSKQIYDILEKRGVKQIDALGKTFDPNFHEAVMQINSDDYPINVVAQELQRGYILNDRVIRPSMVAVSKGPKEE